MPLRVSQIRFFALAGSLVLVVLLGYVVRQRLSADTVDSFRWLEHSHAVRSTILDLNASLTEAQAAAYARALSPDSMRVKQRYDDARRAYPPLLDKLRELTQDNPRQQESIGYLRARIDQNIEQLDAALRSGGPLDPEMRIPIADLSDGLLGEEDRLAAERQANVERRVRVANGLTAATAVAQAILLCIVIWLAERQTTRRVSAERGRLQAVERARLIVESVREPIAVVDSHLALVQANAAFQDFYGIAKPQGVPLRDVPGWTDAVLLQRLADVLSLRRELWDFETEQKDATGLQRRVVVNARGIELPDSPSATALLTVSDITARKAAEEQIVELNRQLSGKIDQVIEVNRELEAFSYSVSHDLRAPLRHIAGFADKLNSKLGDERDAQLAHYCAVIADSARRMSALIEDLLAYSRLGRHALRLQPVDMQSIVEEVRSTLLSAIEGRQFRWRIAPLPVVIADASMLRLVWQNLLDNAIKYTASRDPADIEIGFRDVGDEREFWIGDNGVGFDMSYVDKLFGVFQRLHKASEFQGTGIGLASVRRILARHGGRTWAEAEPGKGATIHFALPRHDTTL